MDFIIQYNIIIQEQNLKNIIILVYVGIILSTYLCSKGETLDVEA